MSTTSLDARDSGRPGSASASGSVRFTIAFLCVLAGAAFVSTAAVAAEPTVDDVQFEDNESWIGLEDEHDLRVEASGIETIGASATVTIELFGWAADALVDDPTVEILTDGVEIDGDVETDGTTITFDINDTSKPAIDLEATVGLSFEHPLESSFDGASYGATVDVTGSDGSADASADVTIKRLSYAVDGTERFPPSTEFVYRNQAVTVEHLEPETSYNLYEFDPDTNALGDPIESVHPGGTTKATIDTSDESLGTGWYIVYEGSDIVPTDENAFQIRTQQLEATRADATVDSVGDGAETSVTLDSPLRSTEFDVTVTSEELDADELFEVFGGEENDDVERIDGSESAITVRDVGSGQEIPMTFEPVLEATYTFGFEVADTNASATTAVGVEKRAVGAQFGSDLFEVAAGEIVEVDVSLEDTGEAYVMIGGDRSSGDRTLTNYFDILHVQGSTTIRINTRLLGTNVPSEEVYASEGGQVTSYLHDPDHEGFDDVTFEGDAGDLSAFRSEIGISRLPRPLQPDRLRLVAGASGSVVVRDDGVPDFERPLARSNLLITDTDGFGNVTTYVAPRGSASEFEGEADLGELRGALTERRTVAKGDRLVFEIEARGLTGLVSWLDERLGSEDIEIDHETLSALLEFPDGVVLDAEQTNPGRNERVTELDIDGATDGELYLVHEPMVQTGPQSSIERYYLVVDTRGTGPFDRKIEPGDEYRFEFGYSSTGETDWFGTVDHDGLDPNGAEPHFPYYGADADNVTETRLVTVEERTVEYDRLDSRDRPVVKNAPDGTISGRTNLAPGTEATIQLIANNRTQPTRITIDDVDIGADGTFGVTHDLSVLEPDEPLEVEFYVDQKLLDKRPAVVAPEGDNLTDYAIAEYTESAAVTQGSSRSTVSATIENTGYLPDRQLVEFTIEGEQVGRQLVELDENEAMTVEFAERLDLDPGEHAYTISADGTEASGRLFVEEHEFDAESGGGTTEPSDSDPDSDSVTGSTSERGTDSSDSESGEDSPDDEPDDTPLGPIGGLIGGLGARHAIGGAAVVGGAHVLGYWN